MLGGVSYPTGHSQAQPRYQVSQMQTVVFISKEVGGQLGRQVTLGRTPVGVHAGGAVVSECVRFVNPAQEGLAELEAKD